MFGVMFLFSNSTYIILFFQKEAQVSLRMIMKELMLQRKKQMMKRIPFLILVIFYHQVLSKAMRLTTGYHHFLQMMMAFMLLNLKMILIRPLSLLGLTIPMLSGVRNCPILLKKKRVLVFGQ